MQPRLSPQDAVLFDRLKSSVSCTGWKYNRNRKVHTFLGILSAVISFCTHRQEDMAKRFLVCGIFPLARGLATQTQSLGRLLGRSKSSINGVFADMGYPSSPITESESRTLQELGQCPRDVRKWTLRRNKVPEEIAAPEGELSAELELGDWDALNYLWF
jgi:hypothetical protein